MFDTKPNGTFVKYRHIASGRVDNMPAKDWYGQIARHRYRSKEFEFIEEIVVGGRGAPVPRETEAKSVPVIEDPLECPLCGLVAQTDIGLRAHKLARHS